MLSSPRGSRCIIEGRKVFHTIWYLKYDMMSVTGCRCNSNRREDAKSNSRPRALDGGKLSVSDSGHYISSETSSVINTYDADWALNVAYFYRESNPSTSPKTFCVSTGTYDVTIQKTCSNNFTIAGT